MIEIERYYHADHWALLWRAYNDPLYRDFFRRTPIGLNKHDVVMELEKSINTKFFIVHDEDKIIGIVSISGECPYSLSCYIGVMIFEEYQKQRQLIPIIFKICEIIFENTNFCKVKLRVLESNERLNRVIREAGLRLEGEYLNEYKQTQTELEYCIIRADYEGHKGKIV